MPRRKRSRPDVGILVEDLQPLVVGLRPHAGEGALPERDPHRGILGVRRVVVLRFVQHDVELGDAQVRLPQPFARLRELHPPPVSRQAHHQTKEQGVVRDQPLRVDGRRGAERARVLRREQAHDPVPRVVREHPLHEGGVDALTDTAGLAFVERGEHTLRVRAGPRCTRSTAWRRTTARRAGSGSRTP